MNRKSYTIGLLLTLLVCSGFGGYAVQRATSATPAASDSTAPATTAESTASDGVHTGAPLPGPGLAMPSGYDGSRLPCTQKESMERYACLIRTAGEGAANVTPGGKSEPGSITPLAQMFVVTEAMNLIRTLASSARYSWNQSTLGADFIKPNMSQQEICLDGGFGICGNHQYLFLEFMQRLGIEARSVGFWYTDPNSNSRASHAAAEVFIDKKWRYVDITWGSLWLAKQNDLLSAISLDEVLAGKGHRFTGTTDVWYIAQRMVKYDPFIYMKGRDLQITRDGGGLLQIRLADQAEKFAHMPNYVGTVPERAPLEMQVSSSRKNAELQVSISGMAGCTQSYLQIGDEKFDIRPGTIRTNTFQQQDRISIDGPDPHCYVVLSSIESVRSVKRASAQH
ncbi:transglutaminase domain-containing protein [Bordetella genomosp. 6]|uniref:transglutaminase domain-containing protein n=1 Tax=Bordetella genomosp. 6 TaxID=463024 RepID=UPI000A29395C|nr:transglutaminase domain-containing protein [Bordetella genomosp. 6]ARP78906.1 transglutaminase [Bordetella genomosp. 6]